MFEIRDSSTIEERIVRLTYQSHIWIPGTSTLAITRTTGSTGFREKSDSESLDFLL
jgi:hypothetical protein